MASSTCFRVALAVFATLAISVSLPDGAAKAGVVVLANETLVRVPYQFVGREGEPIDSWLAAGEVRLLRTDGEAYLLFASGQQQRRYELGIDRAYYFAGDEEQISLHQIDFGQAAGEAAREEDPVRPIDQRLAAGTLGVKLLLDDREPETQRVWERRLRGRIEAAADVLRRHVGVDLEVVAVAPWAVPRSAQTRREAQQALRDIAAEPARLVLGFTRQHPGSANDYAATSALNAPLESHLLLPDSGGLFTEDEALAVLLHELGHYWGAVHVPRPESLMHPQLDAVATEAGLPVFDAASSLMMGIVADEVRTRGVESLAEVSVARRQLLRSIYSALQTAQPDAETGRWVNLLRLPAAVEMAAATPGSRAKTGSTPASAKPASGSSRLAEVQGQEITVPDIPGAWSIFSGVGFDNDGRGWFAVSAEGIDGASAAVFQIDPASHRVLLKGDVIAALRAAGRVREGERQGAIFSEIATGSDGHLYFASLGGEMLTAEPSRTPEWGSHVWRIRLPEEQWELVDSVSEGVISVVPSADAIYLLAGPGTVVYRIPWAAGERRRVEVSPESGRRPQRLIVDARGHCFVLRPNASNDVVDPGPRLVELDAELREIGAMPLPLDAPPRPGESPGIAASFARPSGELVVVTQGGAVYSIRGRPEQASEVKLLGGLSEASGVSVSAVAANLDGSRLVAAVTMSQSPQGWAWWLFEPDTGRSELRLPAVPHLPPGLILQGATTIDENGQFYAAGGYPREPIRVPAALLRALETRGAPLTRRQQLQAVAARPHHPLLLSIPWEQ